MYDNLKKYSKIIVTGPQRSGTRIGAHIIAHDTGHKYIDEKEIGVDNFESIRKFLESDNDIVIQCPGMMRDIEKISLAYPDTMIAVMRRNVDDIVASQKRIGWSEWSKKHELKKYGRIDGAISEIKYSHLDLIKHTINNLIEIDYHSLANHTLFIRKQDRKNFKWSQTK